MWGIYNYVYNLHSGVGATAAAVAALFLQPTFPSGCCQLTIHVHIQFINFHKQRLA